MEEQMCYLEDPTMTKGKTTTRMSQFSLTIYSYARDEYRSWKVKDRPKNSLYGI